MELRHDACRNESRDRHYRRWKPLFDEMIYHARGGYDAIKKFAEANVKSPAREWSRGDASDIDGQAERPTRAGANESKLSEFRRDPISSICLDAPPFIPFL